MSSTESIAPGAMGGLAAAGRSWTRGALAPGAARWGFALACFAVPLALRLYSLRVPVALNPDEAQWTVSARRILDDWVVWRSNDLTTSGPLNALVISWPSLFGATPSLFTSRLTGLVLQSAALSLVAGLVRPGAALGPAAAASAIAALYLGLQTSGEFLHYSSEDLSVALVAGCCAVLAGIRPGRPAAWRWGLCGAALACLPLAKLQSSVLALLLGCVCVARLAAGVGRGRGALADLCAFAAGASLPVALLVVPPFLVGEGGAVVDGYLLLGLGYGGTRTLALFAVYGLFVAVMAALFLCALLGRSGEALAAGRPDLLCAASGLWPALFLTVWLPGRAFPHYGLFLVAGLPLAVALAERGRGAPRAARRGAPPAPTRVLTVATLLVAGFAMQDMAARSLAAHRDADGAAFAAEGSVAGRPLYAWTGAGPRDALLLWGWEPQLTAYAGLRPADRAAHAEYLIRPNRGRDYFRARLLRDLGGALPALVLDTMRPGYFFENDAGLDPDKAGLDSFPALDALVRGRYERVAGRAGCAALWMRRDLVPSWRAAEVALRSTVPQLVEGAMTEKCGEWWAPGPSAPAVATLSPAEPEPIREVWVLASRGGPARDRGAAGARLAFVAPDGRRSERTVRLLDYPSWTVVPNPDGGAVARIELKPLSFVGRGPAIGAVKAFRTSPGG